MTVYFCVRQTSTESDWNWTLFWRLSVRGAEHHWWRDRGKCRFPVLGQHRVRLGGVRRAARIPVLRKEGRQRCFLVFQWAGLGFGKCEAPCKGKGLAKYLIIYRLVCLYIYLSIYLDSWRFVIEEGTWFRWDTALIGAEGKSSIYLFFCWEEKNPLISRAIFHQPKMVLNQSDLADQSTLPHLSDYLRRYQTQSLFRGLQKLEE